MSVRSQVSGVSCLEDLIKYSVRPLLRRHHLNRDVVTGFIGERGGGKDLGGAMVAFLDYMIEGEPCWSNSKIKMTITVQGEDASPFGLSGGQVVYESEDLDKPALLRLEDKFHGGVIYISEINMEFAEARRSISNTNLFFDRAEQQLRKLQSAMIFNVIHEMWIDLRVRGLTDTFIKTFDTSLYPENLAAEKPQGYDFEWFIYPQTRKFNGMIFPEDIQRPIGPYALNLRKAWGLIDTYEKQAAGKFKYGMEFGAASTMSMEIEESKAVLAELDQWGWLYDSIQDLHRQGYTKIKNEALWEVLQLKERGISEDKVGRKLAEMPGISKRRVSDGYMYYIDRFDLEKLPTEYAEKEAVLSN